MALGNGNDPEPGEQGEKTGMCHVSFYGWDEQEGLLSSSLGATNKGRKQTEQLGKDTKRPFQHQSYWCILSQVQFWHSTELLEFWHAPVAAEVTASTMSEASKTGRPADATYSSPYLRLSGVLMPL